MIQPANPEIPEENAHSQCSAAPGAAVVAENSPIDADLARVIDAWPRLSDDERRAVLRIVEAAGVDG